MGNLRTLVLGFFLSLSASVPPLCAQTVRPDDAQAFAQSNPVSLFATCTGRLSALMEFQWLVQDPQSGPTEALRDQMADLLAAALPDGEEVRAMDLRIQAKVAEAALLHEALFGSKDRQAWAWAQAHRLLSRCTALLLS
jgi:hypothetical protein